MSFNIDNIEAAVTEARAKGKERKIKFEQSFDLAVNFRKKELDVSKPENRFNQEVLLPHKLYPPAKVCAFGDGEFAAKAKEAGVNRVVSKEEIPKIAEEKKTRKALAKAFDFFIASIDSMPLVGRYLGQVLGSRGKMPKPFPPQADLKPVVDQYQRTVRVRMRNTPTFHVKVGHERMSDREIAENVAAILGFVENKGQLDKVASVVIKTTMGPSVKVSSWR
ncbi:MAG: 50S ribosomal protein L1 [Candidatus Thorarchaeota archaeon]|nr:MAG: 50S ribosomal protein L1 [Candidatus Thorarchaeota archaeon]